MNHVSEELTVLLLCAGIAAGLYALFYIGIRRKKENCGPGRMAAEYLLLVWGLTFLAAIWLVWSGGEAGEQAINLEPLKPFYLSLRYGVQNRSMIGQFFCGFFWFLPLGFLLPWVFLQFRSIVYVADLSFTLSMARELTELAAGQNSNIDDVIANTVGGMVGYACFVFLYGIRCRKKGRTSWKGYSKSLGAAAAAVLLGLIPAGAVWAGDLLSPFGSMEYSHQRPACIKIADTVPEEKSEAIVYQYRETEDVEQRKERLQRSSGLQGEWRQEEGEWILEDRNRGRITVSPYGRWEISWTDRRNQEEVPKSFGTENELRREGSRYLTAFGIETEKLSYEGMEEEAENHSTTLVFRGEEDGEEGTLWGKAAVTFGPDGSLWSVKSTLVFCEKAKKVSIISPKKAISVAADVGAEGWAGTAYVDQVELTYTFLEDTGYLVPSWKICGEFVADSGEEDTWEPVVDAVD